MEAPEIVLPKHEQRMMQLLSRLWWSSGKDIATHIDGQKSRAGFETKNEIEPTTVADQIMKNWIATFGVLEVKRITKTTLRDVRKVIDEGVAEGLSERQIAAKIRAVSAVFAGNRAQTIARTETHSSSNVAAQATAEATGLNMRRQWVSSKGERTRHTHREADGQIVGMNENFTVGGASLRYPGDQLAGSPRETINCRCAVVFILAE